MRLDEIRSSQNQPAVQVGGSGLAAKKQKTVSLKSLTPLSQLNAGTLPVSSDAEGND